MSFLFVFFAFLFSFFSLLSNCRFQIIEKENRIGSLLRKALIIKTNYAIIRVEATTTNCPLLEKSLDFATEIVLFYEEFSKTRKGTTIAKQLLRSATSIGANINEVIYGNSKANFISKLHISLKKTGECIYWLALLKERS